MILVSAFRSYSCLLLARAVVCSDVSNDVLDSGVCTDPNCADLESPEAVALLQRRAGIRPARLASAHVQKSGTSKHDDMSDAHTRVTGALDASLSSRSVSLTLLDSLGYKDARCLDGSSGGFYYRPASAVANSTRWILHLQGGAECVTEEECIARTFTHLGSSKNWSSNANLGHLLLNESNSNFGSWNAVVFLYCSGDVWTGTQTEIGTTLPGLQFSGHKIIDAVLDHLSSVFALTSADEVILSGDSGGGVGVWLSLDYIRDKLATVPVVVGCSFAGYFFPQSQGNLLYTGMGAVTPYSSLTPADVKRYTHMWSSFLPTRCIDTLPQSPWMCLFGNVVYSSLQTPVFLSQSQFDAVTMNLHDGVPTCIWDCTYNPSQCPQDLVDFSLVWQKALFQHAVGIMNSTRDGVFSPACLMHDAFLATEPLIDGSSAVEAFTSWYFGGTLPTKLVDSCAGMNCNPTCPQGPLIPNPVLGSDPA
mmetsp:Transcript_54580/g.84864  ORF Transcript_54580/g.84864 Transcript_54580/m.84864 type:complete len:477 (+) Transcript_54580:33-1463(+)